PAQNQPITLILDGKHARQSRHPNGLEIARGHARRGRERHAVGGNPRRRRAREPYADDAAVPASRWVMVHAQSYAKTYASTPGNVLRNAANNYGAECRIHKNEENPMALPELAGWKLESMRASFIASTPIVARDLNWWQTLTNHAPEAVVSQPNAG